MRGRYDLFVCGVMGFRGWEIRFNLGLICNIFAGKIGLLALPFSKLFEGGALKYLYRLS